MHTWILYQEYKNQDKLADMMARSVVHDCITKDIKHGLLCFMRSEERRGRKHKYPIGPWVPVVSQYAVHYA